MLILPEHQFIGRGNGRACYAHPDDGALCVKVSLNERGTRESRRERLYLRRAVQRHGEQVHTHIARLYEPVMTDRGRAWIAERVRDEPSGASSTLLRDALTRQALESDPDGWREALDDFTAWTSRSAIVFRDWSSTNLCVKRLADGQRRLVVIDGFAPKEVLLRWFPSRRHARQRNRRYAERAGIHSLETMAALCERERSRPDAHIASTPADRPTPGRR